ncbi:hypothetical protein [Paenibacillus qinlingensis]|uniref:Uncharacterized protein n=1 Tax=Paenibacillus qinlingensis TaxID=1837343 RepID=A0ABU1NR49_9BACL|nr:hypothetical protein [Paenibacillus qinlingensis]MDR6549929.1 hypothetical protein [Paenibacillus qinlingensis]
MRRKSIVGLATLLCAAMAILPLPHSNAHANDLPVGTVVGSVLTTDIRAFVNGSAIRSMNIDGKTAIYVEDLRSHGFHIAWEPNQRQVSIFPDPNELDPSKNDPNLGFTNAGIGDPIADVVATDIHTFALGKEIPSYNVEGRTAVFLQDLSPLLGGLTWNEQVHTASFLSDTTLAADPRAVQSSKYPLQVEQTSGTRFTIYFKDDGLYVGDSRIGFGQDGRVMLSVTKMAQLFAYQTEMQDHGLYLSDKTYGFRITPQQDTVSLYWFNGKTNEVKLTFPTIERDGELYVSEYDLKQLFGYSSNWQSELKQLDIDYSHFDVKDFGVSRHTNNYLYTLKGLYVGPSSSEMPTISMFVSRNGTKLGSNSETSLMEQTSANGSPMYQFSSSVQLDLGNNDIQIVYHIGNRMIYSNAFNNSLTPLLLNPVINYSDLSHGLGSFSSITLDSPKTGLIFTDNDKIELKGAVLKAQSNGLQAVIEKEDNGNWIDSETTLIPFDETRLAASLPLNHGTGRYRVTLRSNLSIPSPRQTTTYIDVARFYVDYRDNLPGIQGMQSSDALSWRDGKLLRTSDNGLSWQVVIPDRMTDKDRLLAAKFEVPLWGYAVYLTDDPQPNLIATHQVDDGVWESVVLPTSEAWETSADVKPIVANLYTDPAYIMLTSSTEDNHTLKSLYRTDDRGKTWIRVGNLSSDIAGSPTGLSYRNAKEGWLTTMHDSANPIPLYRTQDGGETWSLQHADVPIDVQKVSANAYPPVFDHESNYHAIFIAEFIQDNKKTYVIYESRDAGETWLPLPYRLHDLQDIPVLHFDSLLMGRAISQDGQTIYTMDTYNRSDWQPIKPNISLQNVTQFYLRMDGMGWALKKGSVLVTSDGGRTWEEPGAIRN